MAITKIGTDIIANDAITADKIAAGALDTQLAGYLSTNSFATESYVGTAISNLVDSSPATLDTLNELAAALGDDPNFATTTATAIGLKAPLASPSFTGAATFSGNVNLRGGTTSAMSHWSSGNTLVTNVGSSGWNWDSYNGGATLFRITDAGAATFNSTVTGTQFSSTSSSAALPSFGVTAGNGMYNPATNSIGWSTNSVERMRLDASGALVLNNTGGDAQMYFGGTGGTNRMYLARSGGDALLWNVSNGTMKFGTNNTERMRISSAGNIVHNMDTGTALSQYIEGGSSRGYIGSSNSLISGGLTSFCVRGESGIILSVAGNQSIVIDAGGNFFVGATALTANANFFGTSPGNAFSDFGHVSSVASGVAYTRFLYAGSVIGSITQSGTTGVTYTTTSDFRLKKDIKPINNPTQKLLSMNPVTHGWINDPDAKPVVGFIAQEMMNIVPEAIVGDPEGEEMMGMDYGRITPIIVAALQEALKEIEELKTRISKMENK